MRVCADGLLESLILYLSLVVPKNIQSDHDLDNDYHDNDCHDNRTRVHGHDHDHGSESKKNACTPRNSLHIRRMYTPFDTPCGTTCSWCHCFGIALKREPVCLPHTL